jgi:hypothetical protein
MAGDTVSVRYLDGGAEVRLGDRLLQVQRRDNDARTDTCPIELVSAALGS